jgi:hypothetical protein
MDRFGGRPPPPLLLSTSPSINTRLPLYDGERLHSGGLYVGGASPDDLAPLRLTVDGSSRRGDDDDNDNGGDENGEDGIGNLGAGGVHGVGGGGGGEGAAGGPYAAGNGSGRTHRHQHRVFVPSVDYADVRRTYSDHADDGYDLDATAALAVGWSRPNSGGERSATRRRRRRRRRRDRIW